MAEPKSRSGRSSRKKRHFYVRVHRPGTGDTTEPNRPPIPMNAVLNFHARLDSLAAGEEMHVHLLGDDGDTTNSNGPVIHFYLPGSTPPGGKEDEVA